LAVLFLIVIVNEVMADGSELDKTRCHHDRTNRPCHCH